MAIQLAWKLPGTESLCCCITPCVDVAVEWDSSSASGSAPACYFYPFIESPDIRYKKIEVVLITASSKSNSSVIDVPGFPTQTRTYSNYGSKTKTTSVDYTNGCDDPIETCDGPGQGAYHCEWDFPGEGPIDQGSSDAVINTCTDVAYWTSTVPCPLCPDEGVCRESGGSATTCITDNHSLDEPDTEDTRIRGFDNSSTCHDVVPVFGSDPSLGTDTRDTDTTSYSKTTSTLTEEYTIDELLADVKASIPPFDADWDDTPGSLYNRVGWTIFLRRAQYRLAHLASPTGYLKVVSETIFTPETGSPISTPNADYIWTGSPSTPGIIYSSTIPLDEPDTEGSRSVQIISITCEE